MLPGVELAEGSRRLAYKDMPPLAGPESPFEPIDII